MRSEYISKVKTVSFNTFDSTGALQTITEAADGTLLLRANDIAGVEASVTLNGVAGSDWSNGEDGVHTITIDPDDFEAGVRYRLTLEDAEVDGVSIDDITIMEIEIAPQEVDLVKVSGAGITSGTPDVNVTTIDEAAVTEIQAGLSTHDASDVRTEIDSNSTELAAIKIASDAMYKYRFNKRAFVADGVTGEYQLIYYDDDGTTPVATFDLLDAEGAAITNLSTQNVVVVTPEA